MFIKVDDFVKAGWKYFFLIDNHTPNQSGFSRSCRAHNRKEAMRLSAYALNQCFGVGRKRPKQTDKSANMPDANLSSASQSVRKGIQKITRIRITKWWIKITSNERSSFTFLSQQKLRLNGGRWWLFSSKTNRSMLHWEMFVKLGSSITCCSFFQANVTVITTKTSQFHVVHGKSWQVLWTRCLCWRNPTVLHVGKFQIARQESYRSVGNRKTSSGSNIKYLKYDPTACCF